MKTTETNETPETDSLPMTDDPLDFIGMIEHARRLELERNEWIQWAKDILIDFQIPFDDNPLCIRTSFSLWINSKKTNNNTQNETN